MQCARAFISITCMLACVQNANAGGPITVDVLSPGDEGFAGVPDQTRCVDVHIELSDTQADAWTAAGIRCVTTDLGLSGSGGDGRIVYFDGDANTPGFQPGLFNPGLANRFATSLSRPRMRNGDARFTNSGAAAAGTYWPAAPNPVTSDHELNVADFAAPPMSPQQPAIDGYIARIAVDISGITAAGVNLDDYGVWGASAISAAPPSATFVLRSEPASVFASYDHWQNYPSLNWGLWYVPEPASIVGFVAAMALTASFRSFARV